jgi:hypothetical protein
MNALRPILFVVLFALIIVISCETDDIKTDSSVKLTFSSASIKFDTVFTTIGSATKKCIIYNNYNQSIVISSIKIAGGAASPFRFNADGRLGPEVDNIRIEANDSAYIFIEVNVDPTNQNAPLLIEDSLILIINNNQQHLKLSAYGQDIHLLQDSILKTQTWIADKPYIIADAVLVDSSATLTIEAGATIYFHRNGWFGIDGRLIVNGTKDKPVVFRGDRLDKSNYAPPVLYDKIPGQWSEIRFSNSSSGNKLNYAEIRNGKFGIVTGILNKEGQAELELSNCKIYNHSMVALFSIKSKIKAWNCIFANSGWSAFMCVQGGEYEFYHCTFANYPSFGQAAGYAAFIANYATEPDTTTDNPNDKKYYYSDLKKAYFGNCILFGDLPNEVILDSAKNYAFEYTFDHSLIKEKEKERLNLANALRYIKVKVSDKDEPGFSKLDKTNFIYNFELTRTSIAREQGSLDIAKQYPTDYNGNSRIADENPDFGAFEYVFVTGK